ncbi:MAG TPA: Crp/Fnr family transcriptional regulator [Anaerolineales bacterium]|nr:Crp/Fnr family transcriptional regulator [Anaerolineales bacterium]
MEKYDLIRSNPVFSCLNQAELDKLVSQGTRRLYHSGQYLTHAGEVWPYLFILLSGSISAIKESLEGRSLIATTFISGEVFWGVSFFHPELPMPVALKVDEASSLLTWSRDQILPTILENGNASWEMCRLMVSRMLRASEIVEELAFQPVVGRLAHLLITFPGQAGPGPVARSLTLDDMAARIGTTREVVCRFLQRFADQDLIKITRTDFEITDRERLAGIARKVRG